MTLPEALVKCAEILLEAVKLWGTVWILVALIRAFFGGGRS